MLHSEGGVSIYFSQTNPSPEALGRLPGDSWSPWLEGLNMGRYTKKIILAIIHKFTIYFEFGINLGLFDSLSIIFVIIKVVQLFTCNKI